MSRSDVVWCGVVVVLLIGLCRVSPGHLVLYLAGIVASMELVSWLIGSLFDEAYDKDHDNDD